MCVCVRVCVSVCVCVRVLRERERAFKTTSVLAQYFLWPAVNAVVLYSRSIILCDAVVLLEEVMMSCCWII